MNALPNLLGGLASLGWGVADFLGGASARRLPALMVAFVTQVSGLAIMGLALVLVPGDPATRDVMLGAAGGAMGGVGIAMLYRSLALGPMNVAAPSTSVFGTGAAVLAGIIFGERPTALTFVGILAAIVAIVAVSQTPDSETSDHAPGHVRRTLFISAIGGLLLGSANVCYSQTAIESGAWPVTVARIVATTVLLFPALRSRPEGALEPGSLRMPVFGGVADAVAATAMAFALQRGSLVLVGVLGGLYPAVTVLLARIFLKEHLGRPQLLGLGFAVAAVVLLGLG